MKAAQDLPRGTANLVLVTVKNETKLKKVAQEISQYHKIFEFYEEDLNDEMTAFATEHIIGEDRNKFRKYQLLK